MYENVLGLPILNELKRFSCLDSSPTSTLKAFHRVHQTPLQTMWNFRISRPSTAKFLVTAATWSRIKLSPIQTSSESRFDQTTNSMGQASRHSINFAEFTVSSLNCPSYLLFHSTHHSHKQCACIDRVLSKMTTPLERIPLIVIFFFICVPTRKQAKLYSS